jgi:hypothetical protein
MSRGKEKFVMRLVFRRSQNFADRRQASIEPKNLPNRIYRTLTSVPWSGQSKVGNTKLREIETLTTTKSEWCRFRSCHNNICQINGVFAVPSF